jgi:AraC-like DNA-binding protein/quercetin dioxygenase-like cupin family protein
MILMDAPKLRIKDFIAPGDCSHVGRTEFAQGRGVAYHGHDFAEVFWVESGNGVHRRNKGNETLGPGVVCFVRPEDAHGFDGRVNDGLRILNVAFARGVVTELRERYGKEFEVWPWARESKARVELEPEMTHRMSQWAQDLAQHPGSRVRLDRFLMDLLMLTRPREAVLAKGAGPDWLEQARQGFNSPEQFALGVEGFSVLAGRSPEHVNRMLRSVMGVTTTQYINQMRLEWAQRQLRMTEVSVMTVAMDAGFENISYFIRIFKDRYGVTPGVYRERNRGPLPLA